MNLEKELNELKYNLKDVLKNNEFEQDFNIINSILEDIDNIDINKLDIELYEKLNKNINYLEEKYYFDIIGYDLSYVYTPVYVYLKELVRKEEVAKLRKNLRKRKELSVK